MNALLVRVGALGDILLLRRAVFALKAAGCQVSLMAPALPGQVLVGAGASEVGSLLPWESAEVAALLLGDAAKLPDHLGRLDAVIAFTRSMDLLAGLRGAVPRVVAHDPRPPADTHASRWLTAPVTTLGIPDAGDPPSLQPTAAELEAAGPWAAQLPPRFLAVHPGSGSAAKSWPATRFAELVCRLGNGAGWLLVEGPADTEAAAPLRDLPGAVRPPVLPPRALACLLSRAGLYVGNDSGVSHLAAAAGAPTLTLFGPTDPGQWSPVGPRVQTLRSADRSLASLAVDEVVAAALAGSRSCGPGLPAC